MKKKSKKKSFSLVFGSYRLDFLLNQKEGVKGIKFLAATLLLFLALNFLLSIPLAMVEFAIAKMISFLLSLSGIGSGVIFQEPALLLIHNANVQMPIAISYLCTGILETALLVAAIAASFGIEIRKRIIGIVAAAIAIFAFNLLRILATIFLIINFNLSVAEFGHEVLFRLFLFIVIAGFYAVWFWRATKSNRAGIKAPQEAPLSK